MGAGSVTILLIVFCTPAYTPPPTPPLNSFATPIGSPTHMLVYGPGGYRFTDFLRIGLLLNIIILAANIFIVNVVYPLTPLQ